MKTLIASTVIAIAGIAGAPVVQAGELWRATGFEQPESALVDTAHNRIVVSNIVGDPGAADGNGYLSLLSMDGKVIARHWVDGMDAPKGMAIAGGRLYAADITKVRVVDLSSGRLVETIDVPGSVFLNDMTQDDAGKVYVSDMLADTIYRIDGDRPELFVKDPLLASPNGAIRRWRQADRRLVGQGHQQGRFQHRRARRPAVGRPRHEEDHAAARRSKLRRSRRRHRHRRHHLRHRLHDRHALQLQARRQADGHGAVQAGQRRYRHGR
ncbi:hypothetical protein ACVOMV_06735 [Mesorhizobium atlanticum]